MKKKSLIVLLVAMMIAMSTALVSADTDSDFKLVSSYPKDGQKNTSVENVGVKLRFNRDISSANAQKNNEKCVKIVGPDGKSIPIKVMTSTDEKGLMLVLADTNNKKFSVENNSKYTLVISGDLVDNDGNKLGTETKVTFKTFNQQLNTMINMGMMIVIFGGVMVMTVRNANQQKEKKEEKDKKADATFNPYHEAKRTGKSVEEVIAENKKKEEKAAKKSKHKNVEETEYVKDSKLKLSEILPNVYSVSGPRPISVAGGKFKSSRGLASKKTTAKQK
jgi:hypothetical protein